jgi:hypothetical protein
MQDIPVNISFSTSVPGQPDAITISSAKAISMKSFCSDIQVTRGATFTEIGLRLQAEVGRDWRFTFYRCTGEAVPTTSKLEEHLKNPSPQIVAKAFQVEETLEKVANKTVGNGGESATWSQAAIKTVAKDVGGSVYKLAAYPTTKAAEVAAWGSGMPYDDAIRLGAEAAEAQAAVRWAQTMKGIGIGLTIAGAVLSTGMCIHGWATTKSNVKMADNLIKSLEESNDALQELLDEP